MPRPMEQVCKSRLVLFLRFCRLVLFCDNFPLWQKRQMKGICRNISSFARQKGILNSFCTTVFQVLQKPYSGDVYERGALRHLQGVVFVFFRHPRGIRFLYRLRFSAQCAKSGCRNFSEAFALTLFGSRKRFVRSGAAGFCATPCARGGDVLARCRYKSKPRSALCGGLSNVPQCSAPKDGGIGKRTDIFTRGLIGFCASSAAFCGLRASANAIGNRPEGGGKRLSKFSPHGIISITKGRQIWQNTMRRQ